MLAMIEINLLPPEYRPREKTNVPLMFTVAAGILLVGAIILYGIGLNRELGELSGNYVEFKKDKSGLEDEVKKVKTLRNKIARQKARQQTIIEISQSKVMWSLKLQQFSQIMSKFPNFWVKNMSLGKKRGGGNLSLKISATGSNLRDVARFRDAIKDDPNFSYHFDDLQSYTVAIKPLKEGLNFTEVMELSMNLPLKVVEGKKKKRRR